MEYITGMYALNMNSPDLETCGDWHWGALNWQKLHIENTNSNIFGEYGINKARPVPEHPNNKYPIANHIRACLDFMWREYKLDWLRYVAIVRKKYFRKKQYCVVLKQRKKHYFHKYKIHINEWDFYPLRFF